MKKISVTLCTIILSVVFALSSLAFFTDGSGLYSNSVYMVNEDTGRVIVDCNSHEKMFPASLTKVMTCILAIEKCQDLNEKVTVKDGLFADIYAEGGANISLKPGEEISVRDLLYATMVRSACDSATMLGVYVSGDIEAFAKAMNAKAKELGTTGTHFVNAHGLHDDDHYTTAYDMYLITSYALKNDTFREIISASSYTIPSTNKSDARTFSSTIDLENPETESYYEYATGIKSGFTDQAGRCLISMAEKNDMHYVLVTLGANLDKYYGSNMAFADAINLYEYAFAQYKIEEITTKGKVINTIPVEGSETDEIDVTANETISTLVGKDENIEQFFDMKSVVQKGIKKGDNVGTLTVKVGEKSFVSSLVAASDAPKPEPKTIFNTSNKYSNTMYTLATIFFVLAIVIFIFFVIYVSKSNKKHL